MGPVSLVFFEGSFPGFFSGSLKGDPWGSLRGVIWGSLSEGCWVSFWGSPKLYIPSTLNIYFILWHTQLIVCAVKC